MQDSTAKVNKQRSDDHLNDNLECRKIPSIPFPYPPYNVQSQLMERIYITIDQGNVGIFESPTGTGKSLSIICSALQWLQDVGNEPHQIKNNESDERLSSNDKEDCSLPIWLTKFEENQKYEAKLSRTLRFKELQHQFSRRLIALKGDNDPCINEQEIFIDGAAFKRKRTFQDNSGTKRLNHIDGDDDTFLVDEYNSGDDMNTTLDSDSDTEDRVEEINGGKQFEDLEKGIRQIIYASRTHSQTSQFVNEVKKTTFAENVRCITLGSRRNLCINSEVLSNSSDARITDACLDLQKKKSKEKNSLHAAKRPNDNHKGKTTLKVGCKFLSDQGQITFRDHAFAKVRDIEELCKLGQALHICPYYGTRKAVSLAQLIVMPYTSLLQRETRRALGIRLQGNVIIIDEAHNIIEAVNAVHSAVVKLEEIVRAQAQLQQYQDRYGARLKGKNAFYVNTILRILKNMIEFMSNRDSSGKLANSKVLRTTDFLFQASIDNINLFKVERYLQNSDLCRKIIGFVEAKILKDRQEDKVDDTASTHVSSLQTTHQFIAALTNADKDGRIIVCQSSDSDTSSDGEGIWMKFIMLNPAVHFEEIVREAHSVILIGGTMQPTGSIARTLLPAVDESHLNIFSCGHVIPPENLLPICVTRGPSGTVFNFTFSQRATSEQVDELSRLLINTCRLVPGGIVCFLPSFGYMHQVIERWKSTGAYQQICKQTTVFFEPKSAAEVDSILSEYGKVAVDAGNKALLISVVGAKMSEGINFSDDLARCVIMVGMPYPDARDPELKQKLEFANSSDTRAGGYAGRELYQSMCMRAVNQSIGRSIRHARDYSVILLVDERYSRPKVIAQLPKWISDRSIPANDFGEVVHSLGNFFRSRRST